MLYGVKLCANYSKFSAINVSLFDGVEELRSLTPADHNNLLCLEIKWKLIAKLVTAPGDLCS